MGIRINDLPASLKKDALEIAKKSLQKNGRVERLNRIFNVLSEGALVVALPVAFLEVVSAAVLFVFSFGCFLQEDPTDRHRSLAIVLLNSSFWVVLLVAYLVAYLLDRPVISKELASHMLDDKELNSLLKKTKAKLKKLRDPVDKLIREEWLLLTRDRDFLQETIKVPRDEDDDLLKNRQERARDVLPKVNEYIKQLEAEQVRLEVCFFELEKVLAELKGHLTAQQQIDGIAKTVQHVQQIENDFPAIARKVKELEALCGEAVSGLADITSNVQAITSACSELGVNEQGESLRLNC